MCNKNHDIICKKLRLSKKIRNNSLISRSFLKVQKWFCTFFNREFRGLFENVQHFNPRLSGRGEIAENRVGHVLWDTLYVHC